MHAYHKDLNSNFQINIDVVASIATSCTSIVVHCILQAKYGVTNLRELM